VNEEKYDGNQTLDEEPQASPPQTSESCVEPGSEPDADSADVVGAAAQLATLATERDSLAAENDDLRNQLLRRQADFENFRRRVENERADFARYAGMEAVRELLPVLDDLERAVEAAPAAEGGAGEFVKGVEIIYQRFLDQLKKIGLEPIESVGKPFDPNVHHAVDTVETTDADDHTVLEEWQRGYNFKGRLLREAMVKVAVQPAQISEEAESE